MADNLDQIVESSANQRLATGFVFTEGPLWHPDGYWLFVDVRQNIIYKLTPGGQPEVYRDNSGSSNGLTFDAQGRLVICEGNNRQITRMDPTGVFTPIAQRLDGKRINRPNDIVCHSNGSIYFRFFPVLFKSAIISFEELLHLFAIAFRSLFTFLL